MYLYVCMMLESGREREGGGNSFRRPNSFSSFLNYVCYLMLLQLILTLGFLSRLEEEG